MEERMFKFCANVQRVKSEERGGGVSPESRGSIGQAYGRQGRGAVRQPQQAAPWTLHDASCRAAGASACAAAQDARIDLPARYGNAGAARARGEIGCERE